MKIKKFTGKSFQEAFEQMREELGGDAIILNSRKVKPSGLHFMGSRELYEITAAIDEAMVPEQTAQSNGKAQVQAPVYRRPKQRVGAEGPSAGVNGQSSSSVSPSQKLVLQQLGEIRALKDDLQDVKKVLGQVADFLKYSRMPALPEPFKVLLKKLVGNEVNEELATAIVQTVYARLDASAFKDEARVTRAITQLMVRMLKTAPPLETVRRHPYVVALVGPTGVGKTTTVAKIAANLKLQHNRRVALISADTYRIAAIEQLQTFANIASISMSVAYSPQDMREAIHKYRDRDVILIDTVGRSQKHETHLSDLHQFVEAANPDQVHLVMSLTSSLKTLLDVVRRFGVMRPNRFLFTKLDETSSPGNILNVIYKYQVPLSYVTNGQTVPNDIAQADAETLARFILEGVNQG